MPPTISSSVVPFSSCLQSFPASESFPMGTKSRSQFFFLKGKEAQCSGRKNDECPLSHANSMLSSRSKHGESDGVIRT